MPKVRLTIRPWEEIEVPEDEVKVLRSQGLLLSDEAGDHDAAGDDGPGATPAVTTPAGKPADSASGAQEEDA